MKNTETLKMLQAYSAPECDCISFIVKANVLDASTGSGYGDDGEEEDG